MLLIPLFLSVVIVNDTKNEQSVVLTSSSNNEKCYAGGGRGDPIPCPNHLSGIIIIITVLAVAVALWLLLCLIKYCIYGNTDI